MILGLEDEDSEDEADRDAEQLWWTEKYLDGQGDDAGDNDHRATEVSETVFDGVGISPTLVKESTRLVFALA